MSIVMVDPTSISIVGGDLVFNSLRRPRRVRESWNTTACSRLSTFFERSRRRSETALESSDELGGLLVLSTILFDDSWMPAADHVSI